MVYNRITHIYLSFQQVSSSARLNSWLPAAVKPRAQGPGLPAAVDKTPGPGAPGGGPGRAFAWLAAAAAPTVTEPK